MTTTYFVKLSKLALLSLSLMLSATVFGQSKLPPCEGDNKNKWNNCVGTYKEGFQTYMGDILNRVQTPCQ